MKVGDRVFHPVYGHGIVRIANGVTGIYNDVRFAHGDQFVLKKELTPEHQSDPTDYSGYYAAITET